MLSKAFAGLRVERDPLTWLRRSLNELPWLAAPPRFSACAFGFEGRLARSVLGVAHRLFESSRNLSAFAFAPDGGVDEVMDARGAKDLLDDARDRVKDRLYAN
jgi:hypothetical protein